MRRLFLRLRVITVSLVFIVLITGFLVFPKEVAKVANRFDEQEGSNRILLAASAVLADVVLLVIIFQELGFGTPRPVGLVAYTSGGRMEIDPESVQPTLNSQIAALDGIFSVRSKVTAERGRALIELNVDAEQKTNVRKKTKELQREIKKIVESQIGVKMAAKPVIRVQLTQSPEASWLPDTPTEAPEGNGVLKKEKLIRKTQEFTFKPEGKDPLRPDTMPRDTTPRPGELKLPEDNADKFNW